MTQFQLFMGGVDPMRPWLSTRYYADYWFHNDVMIWYRLGSCDPMHTNMDSICPNKDWLFQQDNAP